MLALVFTFCHTMGARAQTPLGPETRVNMATNGSQTSPRLALLRNGAGFFGAWNSPDTSGGGVTANYFFSNGTQKATEFEVPQSTNGQQNVGTVTVMTNGDIGVGWSDHSTGQTRVRGRVFAPSGPPQTSDIPISTTQPSDRLNFAALGSGQVAAVWQSLVPGDGTWDVRGRVLSDTLGGVSGETTLSTNTTGDQQNPKAKEFQTGGFVAGWDTTAYGIPKGVIRLFGNDLTPLSGEILVRNNTLLSEERLVFAAFPDDRFAVAYECDDGSGKDICVQYHHKNGTQIAPSRRVNTVTTSQQVSPTIAVVNNDLVVLGWGSTAPANNRSDIIAQMLDGNGEFVGREFRVHDYITSEQTNPFVIETSNKTFRFAWWSDGQGGPFWNVWTREFNITVLPIVTTGTTGSTGTTATSGSTGTTGSTGTSGTTGTTAFVNPTSTTATAVSAGSSPTDPDLTGVWVVLGVGGCLIVGGVGAFLLLRRKAEESSPASTPTAAAPPITAKSNSTDTETDDYDNLPIAPTADDTSGSTPEHYDRMPTTLGSDSARDKTAAARGNYQSIKIPKP